jgi:HlyD family secretion protein
MEQKSSLKNQLLSKRIGLWTIILMVIATLGTVGTISYRRSLSAQTQSNLSQTESASVPVRTAVTALGRLEPKGEVIYLSAPSSAERVRIQKLFVKEKERVRKGQLIAILDTHDRLVVALQQAKQNVIMELKKERLLLKKQRLIALSPN